MVLETFYTVMLTFVTIVSVIALIMLSYLIFVILRYEIEQRRCKSNKERQDTSKDVSSSAGKLNTDRLIDIKDFEYQAVDTNTETINKPIS